jgi:hypothetical protein
MAEELFTQETYLRRVAEGLGHPQFCCKLRACRRAGRCCGALIDDGLPVCVGRSLTCNETYSDCFVRLCSNMFAGFAQPALPADWAKHADPDQMVAAAAVMRSLLPNRFWRRLHRYLTKITAETDAQTDAKISPRP